MPITGRLRQDDRLEFIVSLDYVKPKNKTKNQPNQNNHCQAVQVTERRRLSALGFSAPVGSPGREASPVLQTKAKGRASLPTARPSLPSEWPPALSALCAACRAQRTCLSPPTPSSRSPVSPGVSPRSDGWQDCELWLPAGNLLWAPRSVPTLSFGWLPRGPTTQPAALPHPSSTCGGKAGLGGENRVSRSMSPTGTPLPGATCPAPPRPQATAGSPLPGPSTAEGRSEVSGTAASGFLGSLSVLPW